MKKIKKSTLTTIILILFTIIMSVSFTACDYSIYNIDYELIELKKAYYQGKLSDEDMKNIAYYSNGCSNKYNENVISEDFIPKPKAELSEEVKDLIRKSIANYWSKKSKKIIKYDNVRLGEYYGEYNGYIVICRVYESLLNDVSLVTLGGVKVSYADDEDIYLWKKL